MKKKVLAFVLAGALAALPLAGCGASGSGGDTGSADSAGGSSQTKISEMSDDELQQAWQQEEAYGKTVTVAYNGGACLGGFGIAQSEGYYEDEGLDVKIVNVSGMVHEAVATGKADAGGDHIATVTAPIVNGMQCTIVTPSQTGCKSLYVLDSSDIKSTSDLAGKTVAVPEGIGTSDQNMVYRYLINDGLDINSVKYKQVSTDAAIEALKKGQIQAVNAADMWARPFVKNGTLRAIRSITTDEDFQDEPCCVMVINNDFLKKNPITSYKLTKAFSDANHWIQDNPEKAAQEMIDNKWATGTVDEIAGFIKEWNFDITDQQCETTLTRVLDDYKSCGIFENNDFDTNEMLGEIWNPVLTNS